MSLAFASSIHNKQLVVPISVIIAFIFYQLACAQHLLYLRHAICLTPEALVHRHRLKMIDTLPPELQEKLVHHLYAKEVSHIHTHTHTYTHTEIYRVFRGLVDINFSKENFGKSLLDGEVFHFSVGARILGAELIAGKANHSELVGADQRRQLGEFSIVGIS
jgi:hypothetical protein